MPNPEVYIVSAVRTAIGSFGGTLKDTPLSVLATTAVRAALQRSGCAAERVGHVVMGNVIPSEPQDSYISRVAALNAGIPQETPRVQRQSPVWLGFAGDHLGGPKPAVGRN